MVLVVVGAMVLNMLVYGGGGFCCGGTVRVVVVVVVRGGCLRFGWWWCLWWWRWSFLWWFWGGARELLVAVVVLVPIVVFVWLCVGGGGVCGDACGDVFILARGAHRTYQRAAAGRCATHFGPAGFVATPLWQRSPPTIFQKPCTNTHFQFANVGGRFDAIHLNFVAIGMGCSCSRGWWLHYLLNTPCIHRMALILECSSFRWGVEVVIDSHNVVIDSHIS